MSRHLRVLVCCAQTFIDEGRTLQRKLTEFVLILRQHVDIEHPDSAELLFTLQRYLNLAHVSFAVSISLRVFR